MRQKEPSDIPRIALYAILFLFFLQALSDFIQSIYAFGLLVTAFTIQLAAILLLFTPLGLIFMRRPPSRPWFVGIAGVAMLGRLLEPMLDPGARLVACGISVGAFMLLFPLMLASRAAIGLPESDNVAASSQVAAQVHPESSNGWRAAFGLLIAVSLSVCLRALGRSLDLSEYGIFQLLAWALAMAAVRLVWDWPSRESELPSRQEMNAAPRLSEQAASHEARREDSLRALQASSGIAGKSSGLAARSDRRGAASTPHLLGSCIGLASVLVMIYFAFASPTVIAGWTNYSYPAILVVLMATLFVFALFLSSGRPVETPSRGIILAWNGLFVLMLVLTILPHQVMFPQSPNGYPLNAPPASRLAMIPLFLMLILSPVIFVDFMLYTRQTLAAKPSMRQLGGGFGLGALFILVMVFLHVFTTIYDYAKPIGPLVRDRFWLVYLLAGLGLMLPLWLLPVWGQKDAPKYSWKPHTRSAVISLAALFIGTLLYVMWPRPAPISASHGLLRVMTFNIQQGFDKVGNADLPGQLAAIEEVSPDILGIQESDTARVANGNVDAVRYFAEHLNMYSYYGPTTTAGTFGIALLSKFPIQDPRTFYLYSTGEQTAAIQAQIRTANTVYNVFVTHLGNGGPMVQLQGVLQRVHGLPNVILVGDFNFTPATPQYKLATESLADAWLLRWPGGRQVSGLEDRIDLMLISPGTQVLQAEYVPNPDSDHPYAFMVIEPKSLAERPAGPNVH